MKNCTNMMPENRKVRMADRKSAVKVELMRDNVSSRLERSPGEYCLANDAGNSSNRDIRAVCSPYSTLSLIRITTRLRAICTIARPTAALASRVAMGTS